MTVLFEGGYGHLRSSSLLHSLAYGGVDSTALNDKVSGQCHPPGQSLVRIHFFCRGGRSTLNVRQKTVAFII